MTDTILSMVLACSLLGNAACLALNLRSAFRVERLLGRVEALESILERVLPREGAKHGNT